MLSVRSSHYIEIVLVLITTEQVNSSGGRSKQKGEVASSGDLQYSKDLK